MKKEKKISYSLYPNRHKISKKTQKCPIYLRIIIGGEKVEFSTGIELYQAELDYWNKETQRISTKSSQTNIQLNKYQAQIDDEHAAIEMNHLPISAASVKSIINGNQKQKSTTICGFVEDYYLKSIENNVNLTKGTKKNYRKAINHLKNFLSNARLNEISLTCLNFDLAQDFKNYLTNDNVLLAKKGMCDNSAKGIIKKFRTIFNLAVSKSMLQTNPFNQIKIKASAKPTHKLSIEQVKSMGSSKELTDSQQIYTDIFMFSVYTGLSYSDAQNLTKHWLIPYPDNQYKIDSNRVKSKGCFEFFLVKPALDLINKYENSLETSRGNLIPKRSNKEINLQLKVLGDKAGIPFNFTHHTARHTFRRIIAEAEMHDVGTRKKMMGHSTGSDIDGIYDQVTDDRLLKAKEKIDLYLNKHIQIS